MNHTQSPITKETLPFFNVIHFAFNYFRAEPTSKRAFKNGTEYEILRLLEDSMINNKEKTTHLLISFTPTKTIRYENFFKSKKSNIIIKLSLPVSIYKLAKESNEFRESNSLIQVIMKELKTLKINQYSIIHFHSWESGLLLTSPDFIRNYKNNIKIFSPYLTVHRLHSFMYKHGNQIYTIPKNLCKNAAKIEELLAQNVDFIFLESKADLVHYSQLSKNSKCIQISFLDKKIKYNFSILKEPEIRFIAGGRPVYEKGFIELIDSFYHIIMWGKSLNILCILDLYCNGDNLKEGHLEYIHFLQKKIYEKGLEKYIKIRKRVCEKELIKIVKTSSCLLVPSLFDPFCLMPKIAFLTNKAVFVSKFSGISENIKSEYFVYNPLVEKELLYKIKKVVDHKSTFLYQGDAITYLKAYNINELYNHK